MAAPAPDVTLASPASPSPPASAAALRRMPRVGDGRPAPTARTTVICSILDSSYLTRFLVLHGSVVRHWPGVHWRPCCMDAGAKAVLDRLCLPRVTPLAVDEVEAYDPDLASVRVERNALEYCSTVKPSLCRYALDRQPGARMVAYLDADLMFFQSPATFLDELEGASVLLVPQRHPADRPDLDAAYGRYQAGSLAFRRDEDGLGALAQWRARCLEECALDPDAGRWADQTHLDELPRRFAGVRILGHPGGGVAPWNASRYRIERDHSRTVVDGRPLLFYHYSGLRLYSGPRPAIAASAALSAFERSPEPARLGWRALHYPIAGRERSLIWEPYIEAVSKATVSIHRETSLSDVVSSSWWDGLRDHVLRERLLRLALGQVRRALNAGRRGVRSARCRLHSLAGSLQWVEWGLDRAVGRLDRARSRWGVE